MRSAKTVGGDAHAHSVPGKRLKRRKKPTQLTQDKLDGREVPSTEPASNEVTDATIVGDANAVLWKRAIESKDRLLIGASHVLNSVWIMLRTRDKRACRTMATLAKLCVAHRVDHMREALDGMVAPIDPNELKEMILRDRAAIEDLPSIAGLDRHLNVAYLHRFTDYLWRTPIEQQAQMTTAPAAPIAEKDLVRAAKLFVLAVQMQFPDLAQATEDDVKKCANKVAAAWQRRARLLDERNKGIDSALMVVDGLKAIGLTHNEAHNWIKSAVRATTQGTGSERREQERSAHGRFGSNRSKTETQAGRVDRRRVDGTNK